MATQILTFNSGSSSLKVGLFAVYSGHLRCISKQLFKIKNCPSSYTCDGSEFFHSPFTVDDASSTLNEVLSRFSNVINLKKLEAASHRVVFGGDVFRKPVRIIRSALDQIESFTKFAPLHQPRSTAFIRAIHQRFPKLVQTASFDTVFHQTIPETTRSFAIPRQLYNDGIKKYGFHGLSYQSIVNGFRVSAPKLADEKIVVAHLGSGASICALQNGESRDTSMGFSTLDGVPMATRCGALDPGIILYWLQNEHMTAADISDLLYNHSGLRGISAVSGDMRQLLASPAPEATIAIDLFTLRIAGEICRLASSIGGFKALIFTAGIGENQPKIRAAICQRLAWLGVELDSTANSRNAFQITSPTSKVAVFVMATDEERIIASEALTLLSDHTVGATANYSATP